MHTLLLEALCTDCYNLGDAVDKGKMHLYTLQLSEECSRYISMHVLDLIMIGDESAQLTIFYTKLNNNGPNLT